MNEIVQKEHEILRKVAETVPIEDIRSRKVETIIRRMIKALNNEDDGVAIAAPQIGESLRIFIVSKKTFEIIEKESVAENSKREDLDKFEKSEPKKDMVFINPEILKTSKKRKYVEEGCLSVRWLYGKVERAEKALVKAYDENGKMFTIGGSGLLAQIFQHEIDHLDGILFTDKAKDLEEILPEKIKQKQ